MDSFVAGIGQRLRELRGHMSQPRFAQQLDIHKNTVYRYEKEESFPDAECIGRICSQFDVSADWLLFGEGDAKATNVSYLHIGHGLHVGIDKSDSRWDMFSLGIFRRKK